MVHGKINIIHAVNVSPEIIIESSVYAPKDMVYVLLEHQSMLQMGKSLYAAEKERNDWIRKYDRLLQGLNYWKDRALSK